MVDRGGGGPNGIELGDAKIAAEFSEILLEGLYGREAVSFTVLL